MSHRIVQHVRGNVVAYLALTLAIGGGGGYAIAATTGTKTITACASKKTGELFLHTHGRCTRGQTKVTWNQQGPQGKTGATGAGASTAFAVIDSTGLVTQGQGISVQHVGTGDFEVTITATGCSTGANVPTVTPTQANNPTEPVPPAGSVPMAWIADTGPDQNFVVHTGFQEGASFTPEDLRFDVQDACQLSGGRK